VDIQQPEGDFEEGETENEGSFKPQPVGS